MKDRIGQIADGDGAVIKNNERPSSSTRPSPAPPGGGEKILRADAGAYLIDVLRCGFAVVVPCDSAGDTDVLRCVNDDDPVAERIQAGLEEDGGFDKEQTHRPPLSPPKGGRKDVFLDGRMDDGVEGLQTPSCSPWRGRGKDTFADILRIIHSVHKSFFAEEGDDLLLHGGVLGDDTFGFAVTVIDGKAALA